MPEAIMPHLVRIIFLDVDGTLTDGVIGFTREGDVRHFWVRDGLALEWAREAGILPVVISGRSSLAVTARMHDLKLEHYLGAKDKVAVKSVGAAYAKGKLMLTIGYRDDEEPYEVALHSSKIGRVGPLDDDEMQRFTRAIVAGGNNWPPVLGHTLYVTKDGDLYLVVLSLVEAPREE